MAAYYNPQLGRYTTVPEGVELVFFSGTREYALREVDHKWERRDTNFGRLLTTLEPEGQDDGSGN